MGEQLLADSSEALHPDQGLDLTHPPFPQRRNFGESFGAGRVDTKYVIGSRYI